MASLTTAVSTCTDGTERWEHVCATHVHSVFCHEPTLLTHLLCHRFSILLFSTFQVTLSCKDRVFCVASSTLSIFDRECQQLFETGACGIGQLFRRLDLLPKFSLLECGLREDGTWFRVYRLDAPGRLHCLLREEFIKDVFDL